MPLRPYGPVGATRASLASTVTAAIFVVASPVMVILSATRIRPSIVIVSALALLVMSILSSVDDS